MSMNKTCPISNFSSGEAVDGMEFVVSGNSGFNESNYSGAGRRSKIFASPGRSVLEVAGRYLDSNWKYPRDPRF